MTRLRDRVAGGGASRWTSPQIFDLTRGEDAARLEEVLARGLVTRVTDPLETYADDLYELEHPDRLEDTGLRAEFVEEILRQGDEFGVWVFFGWSGELVHYPDAATYRELRTWRFRNLLSAEDLLGPLATARIAVFGLSVGSNLLLSLVRNGIGGAFAIGDLAEPGVPNLGRASFDVRDLGTPKLDAVAKQLSILDPFAEQLHFPSGLRPDDLPRLADFAPDIVGEEVDHMPTSALLRTFSAQHHRPFVCVSDVHDSVVLEVCRHDVGPSPLFAGSLPDSTADRLLTGAISDWEHTMVFTRTVGRRHLSPRLVASALSVGSSLAGIPQLGSTALGSAALGTVAYREILLGHHAPKTGLYRVRLAGALGHRSSGADWLAAVKGLGRHALSS